MSGLLAASAVGLHAIGGAGRLFVDRRGVVQPEGRPWAATWWIGAGDRWHRAEVETAVRQSVVCDGAVVETSMRVPGGDIVHRATVVAGTKGPAGLVEIENGSGVAVALALVAVAGGGEPLAVGDDGLLAGTTPVVRVDAPVAAGHVSPGTDLDALLRTVADAAPAGAGHGTDPGQGPAVAAVWSLAPVARRRIAFGLDAGVPMPSTLPSIDQVRSGWAAHLDRLPSVELPDGLGALVRRLRYRLSGPTPTAPIDAELFGLARSAMGVVPDIAAIADPLAEPEVTAANLVVAAEAAVRLDVVPVADDSAAEIVLAADRSRPTPIRRRLRRRAALTVGGERLDDEAAEVWRHWWDRAGRWSAAELLDRLGERDAAAATRRGVDAPDGAARLRALERSAHSDHGRDWLRLAAMSQVSAAGFADRVAGPLADRVSSTLDEAVVDACCALVVDRLIAADRADRIELLPGWRGSWRGRNLEVHDWPTRWGRLSYALRWHGERPALLWELDTTSSGCGPPVLRAPTLDVSWETAEASGEALLAG